MRVKKKRKWKEQKRKVKLLLFNISDSVRPNLSKWEKIIEEREDIIGKTFYHQNENDPDDITLMKVISFY